MLAELFADVLRFKDGALAGRGRGDVPLGRNAQAEFTTGNLAPAMAADQALAVVNRFQWRLLLAAEVQRHRAARRKHTGGRAFCQ